MTDDDLAEIAAGDHPNETERHRLALVQLRQSMQVQGRLGWNPKEAVELERWEKPVTVAGHRRRLFACAILADAYFEEASREVIHPLSDILAPLIESSLVLGEDVVINARRSVLAFLTTPFPWWEDSLLFAGVGSLVFCVARAEHAEDQAIAELSDWIVGESLRLRGEELSADHGPGLLGHTHFNQYHTLWQAMSRRYLLDPSLPYSAKTMEKLRAIGTDIVGWTKP